MVCVNFALGRYYIYEKKKKENIVYSLAACLTLLLGRRRRSWAFTSSHVKKQHVEQPLQEVSTAGSFTCAAALNHDVVFAALVALILKISAKLSVSCFPQC